MKYQWQKNQHWVGGRDFFEYVLWMIYDVNEYFVFDNIESEYLGKI